MDGLQEPSPRMRSMFNPFVFFDNYLQLIPSAVRQNAVDKMPSTKHIQQNAVIQKHIHTKGLQDKMSSCDFF